MKCTKYFPLTMIKAIPYSLPEYSVAMMARGKTTVNSKSIHQEQSDDELHS